MSHSDHSKKPRHLKRVSREGGERQATRAAIRNGNWDDMLTTMPTRAIRRPNVLVGE